MFQFVTRSIARLRRNAPHVQPTSSASREFHSQDNDSRECGHSKSRGTTKRPMRLVRIRNRRQNKAARQARRVTRSHR